MVVSTELYASAFFLGNAAAISLTVDSPRAQRIFISLSSASVSVGDFLGGIHLTRNQGYCYAQGMSTNLLILWCQLVCSGQQKSREVTLTLPTGLQPTSRPPIDIITSPFTRFARMEAAGGILLLVATAAALIWANSPWEHSYHEIWFTQATITLGPVSLSESRHEWVNDGLMSIFFFLVGLEIKRELLIGELSSFRQAAFPFMAAIGGSIVPAMIYFALNKGGAGANGWGIPMATDIAFALGVLALLGSRIPVALKVFVAALAIVDDIFGVVVIALFYTQHISLIALGMAFVGVAVSFGANWLGIRNPAVYALIGVGVWAAVLNSGVHATIAGILLAFTIPARSSIDKAEFLRQSRWLLDQFEQHDPNSSQAHHAIHSLEQKCEMIESPLHRIQDV